MRLMYKIAVEGETQLYIPDEGSFGKRVSGLNIKPPVFYNPHMALNRSLCVLFMKVAGSELVFADILAAAGSKGLRVAVEGKNRVFFNDANKEAITIIRKNLKLNGIKAEVSNRDANLFVSENQGLFDFIDIDPFGSPVPFIDASIQSLKKEGYLGGTATDTATLCGVYPSTCVRRYESQPTRSSFCHEVGLRILIGYVARRAAVYDKGVSPILSHSTRHYFRFYLRLKNGVKAARKSLKEMGFLYHCDRCDELTYERGFLPSKRTCKCGERPNISGPLWLGALHKKTFIKKMLSKADTEEVKRILSTIAGEVETPFYYNVHLLAKRIKATPRDMETILNRLRDSGYASSRTHFSPVSIKTEAPKKVIEQMIS
jgi:tRNA (guanine26-N2/guanine27-N2)-dimethyltransferase